MKENEILIFGEKKKNEIKIIHLALAVYFGEK